MSNILRVVLRLLWVVGFFRFHVVKVDGYVCWGRVNTFYYIFISSSYVRLYGI